MPELPDVAGFERYLDATGLHRRIERTSVTDERILDGLPAQGLGRRLAGAALESTRRHGKSLFVRTSRDLWLVLHFGMTGELAYYGEDGETPRHAKVVWTFENGAHLVYQSRRLLGRVTLTDDPEAFVEQQELGPDALCEALTADRFAELLSGRRGRLQGTFTDQSVLAGIGNVWVDEVLFQAGLDPRVRVDELDEDDVARLYRVIRRVLRVSARHGADPAKLPRGYLVPRREADAPCPRCRHPIAKTTLGGRATYSCPRCQGGG